jgi:protocatechuate 3,4-dioxygenase beta subunit
MSLLITLSLAGALIQSPVVPPGAAVSGRVVEEGGGAPIVGAQVTLIASRFRPSPSPLMDRPRTAMTDQEGRYEFDTLEAGRYRLIVQKAGFAAMNGLGMPELDLKGGERRDGVIVTLQRGAVIVGRVLDENGEPLVDSRVMALQKSAVRATSSRGMLMPAGPGAQTNDLGEFRLFSLPPGEYYVLAMPGSHFGGSPASHGTAMLPTYFPGSADSAAAHPITVGGGQTSGDVVIRMISTPAFQVSGVVIDEAGRPVVNAMVRLMADEPTAAPIFVMSRSHPSRTDTSGRFTINSVTNGTYNLLASAPVVISGPSNQRGVVTGGSNGISTWSGVSGGVVTGMVGGGVTTETSNGTTIQYRDDTATRVPITINQANISGLEVIVRRPVR